MSKKLWALKMFLPWEFTDLFTLKIIKENTKRLYSFYSTWKRNITQLTLDCSEKPAKITWMCSAIWQLASNGMGWQADGVCIKALWIKAPRSSQDNKRIWLTQSTNSFGLYQNLMTLLYN